MTCDICRKNIAMVKVMGLWMCPKCARDKANDDLKKSKALRANIGNMR